MLSRISKNENNNVKHHFELAAGAPEASIDFSRRSSKSSDTHSRRPSTYTDPIASDDDEIEALFEILITHNDDIVDLYEKKYQAIKMRSLTETECTALIAAFITLETKYNDSKEVLLKKKLSNDDKKKINEMDSNISKIKIIVLTHCRNTKVEDKEIETKLAELDTIIKEGKPIIDKHYGYGVGTMSEENCKEMRDWCVKTVHVFKEKLEYLRDRVMKNRSLPYIKRFTEHETYLKGLEKTYKDVQTKCKVKDEKIETKLADLDKIKKDGESIKEKNYGTGWFSMSEANCKEMRDWFVKNLPLIEKELKDLKNMVQDNGSLSYINRFTDHENYLNNMKTTYDNVIKKKCVGK